MDEAYSISANTKREDVTGTFEEVVEGFLGANSAGRIKVPTSVTSGERSPT